MAGQSWSIAADGGHFANPILSSKLRFHNTSRYVFRQFTRPEPGYGKHRDETIDFDKVSMAESQGGKIGEFQDRISKVTAICGDTPALSCHFRYSLLFDRSKMISNI